MTAATVTPAPRRERAPMRLFVVFALGTLAGSFGTVIGLALMAPCTRYISATWGF